MIGSVYTDMGEVGAEEWKENKGFRPFTNINVLYIYTHTHGFYKGVNIVITRNRWQKRPGRTYVLLWVCLYPTLQNDEGRA